MATVLNSQVYFISILYKAKKAGWLYESQRCVSKEGVVFYAMRQLISVRGSITMNLFCGENPQ